MSQSLNITDRAFQFASALALPANHVQLWRVDLEAVAAQARWQGVLSSDEQARAMRFRFPRDSQRFTATRAVLRMTLAAYAACDPRQLTFSYSSAGKPAAVSPPSAVGISFNVSHSGEVALLAFTRGRNIGVDVEKVRQDVEVETLARRFFSPHEQQELAALGAEELRSGFFRCWTRKEAYVKAVGAGLSLALDEFDVSIARGETDALRATRPDGKEAERWSLREVPAGPGHVAALCVYGRDWHLKDWSRQDKQ